MSGLILFGQFQQEDKKSGFITVEGRPVFIGGPAGGGGGKKPPTLEEAQTELANVVYDLLEDMPELTNKDIRDITGVRHAEFISGALKKDPRIKRRRNAQNYDVYSRA